MSAGANRYPAFTGTEPCTAYGISYFCQDGEISDERFAELKAICNGCPIFTDCLLWALHNEKHYFWAGTRPKDRDALRKMFDIELRSWEHA